MTAPLATQTLAARILDQLEADEAAARAATPGPWTAFRAHARNQGEPDWFGVTRDLDVDYDPDIFSSQRCTEADAAHIAMHDTARVLAQCKAVRAVVERAQCILDSWEAIHYGDPKDAMWHDVNRREKSHAYSTLVELAGIWGWGV